MAKDARGWRGLSLSTIILVLGMTVASCASNPPPEPSPPSIGEPLTPIMPPQPTLPTYLFDPDDVSSAHGNLAPYPWPPERPSTQFSLRQLFDHFEGYSLSSVGDVLRYAADTAGYGDKSFYSAPNGFVLATRLEATTPEGKRLEGMARYSLPMTRAASLANALADITNQVQAGNFRYIAIVVTDQPIVFSGAVLDGSVAIDRALSGATSLDGSFNARPFTDDHDVLALIYEFKASGQPVDSIELLRPSVLGGSDHLVATGLYASIQEWTASAAARGLRAP